MRTVPSMQPIRDLIPISQAAKLLPPKRGKSVHKNSIKRWGSLPWEADKGSYRVYAANGWKVSQSAFVEWAARTHRLVPHVLVAS